MGRGKRQGGAKSTRQVTRAPASSEPTLTVDEDGTKVWLLPNGRLHRLDGPAVERPSGGMCEWWVNGRLHREDGPAMEWRGGCQFALNGEQMEPEKWGRRTHFTGRTKYIDVNSRAHWVDGKLHRIDGPAVEQADGMRWWFQNGKFHRLDGPAVEDADDNREWRQHGKLHRIDGPAVEKADGEREWWRRGKLHRTDGPAVEKADGVREWRLNGDLHRTDGPAVIFRNGRKQWWLEGVKLSKAEWQLELEARRFSELKVESNPRGRISLLAD